MARHGGQRRQRLGQCRRVPDGAVGDTGAEGDRAVFDGDLAEARHPADIDEGARSGDAQVHGGDQALAAGQHPRLGTVLGKQNRRFLDRGRREILEGGGAHG